MDKKALAHEYLGKCGEILGPIYYAYIKWAEERIKHEQVFATMRGGLSILNAGKICAENKLADTGNWQELWINRRLSGRAFYDKSIKRYIDNETNGRPFTMLDNGYSGTIPDDLNEVGYTNMQTLYVASEKYFLESPNGDERDAYIVGSEGLYTFRRVAEQIPVKYRQFNRVGNIGIESISSTKKYDAFCNGMANGIIMSANYQKNPDKKQTIELLSIIEQHVNEIEAAFDCALIKSQNRDLFDARLYNRVKRLYK